MEELALCCYGVEVRLVDAAGLGLCQRLRDTLPPEFAAPSGPGSAVVAYVVTAGTLPGTAEHPGTPSPATGSRCSPRRRKRTCSGGSARTSTTPWRGAHVRCSSCTRVWSGGGGWPSSSRDEARQGNRRWSRSSSGGARCTTPTSLPCSTIQAGSTRIGGRSGLRDESGSRKISVSCGRTSRRSPCRSA